jgi:hypothetical protein
MAILKGKVRKGASTMLESMIDSVWSEADHWVKVALYASSVGDAEAESMALQRVAQLERIADMQSVAS